MTTATILQFSQEDLRTEIREALREILQEQQNKASEPTLQERGGIELAEQVLGRSKSWLYKATSQNIIPYKKFGSKIIFNRADLEQWLEERAIDPARSFDVIDEQLKKSANKKISKI
jgi:excisionase family DNA binding protein